MGSTWHVLTIATGIGFLLEAVLLVAVMRQVGSLLLVVGTSRPIDLPAGPKLGTVMDLPGYDSERPALVVFVSPDCQQCHSLTPAFSRISASYTEQLELVAIVSHVDYQARIEYAAEIGRFARTDLPALIKDWEIPGTPFAVALDSSRRVRGSGIVNTLDQLETLAVMALDVRPTERADRDGAGADTVTGAALREEVIA